MFQNGLKFRLGLDTPRCAVFWLASFLETTSYTRKQYTHSFIPIFFTLLPSLHFCSSSHDSKAPEQHRRSRVIGCYRKRRREEQLRRQPPLIHFSSCFFEFSTGARGKHSRNRRSREGCSSRPPTDPLHRDLILIGRKKRRHKRAHLLRLSVARRNRRCESTESL